MQIQENLHALMDRIVSEETRRDASAAAGRVSERDDAHRSVEALTRQLDQRLHKIPS